MQLKVGEGVVPDCTLKRFNVAYNAFVLHFELGVRMTAYKELIEENPSETVIRSYLVDSERVPVTLRIPETLRDAAKDEAALRGMSFSAFVRTCLIEELAKRGV